MGRVRWAHVADGAPNQEATPVSERVVTAGTSCWSRVVTGLSGAGALPVVLVVTEIAVGLAVVDVVGGTVLDVDAARVGAFFAVVLVVMATRTLTSPASAWPAVSARADNEMAAGTVVEGVLAPDARRRTAAAGRAGAFTT
jgi:hypothetical protein